MSEPGYTSESLDMLKTEEGQNNAVFACFGSAAQHGQFFEASLADFLVTYNKLCNKSWSLGDFEPLAKKLRRRTMGQLLRELEKVAEIDKVEVYKLMNAALDARNFLMHEFFLKRSNDLQTEEGRMGMLGDLLTIENLFREAAKPLGGMRVAMERALSAMENGELPAESEGEAIFTMQINVPESLGK